MLIFSQNATQAKGICNLLYIFWVLYIQENVDCLSLHVLSYNCPLWTITGIIWQTAGLVFHFTWNTVLDTLTHLSSASS